MDLLKSFCLSVLLSSVTLAVSASSPDDSENETCDTIAALAQALYTTKGNLLNMNKIFFPPLQASPKFLRVVYQFLDVDNSTDNCSVSYIWAEGGFLLIQPPLIFQFTSLFFNHIANNNYNYHLELTLPSNCRHLVNVDDSNQCLCTNDTKNHELLDTLTHQVLLC